MYRNGFDEDRSMIPVCANCKEIYIDGDRYCRYCGAPLGQPAYIPEDFACIYGPEPVEREHYCSRCGYTWITTQMIDKENYCPKCGGYAPGRCLDPSEEEDLLIR